MPSTSQRYPLSTPDGISIPLDIVRPHSCMLIDFTLVVSTAINVPTGIQVMSMTASEDCVISFGGTAVDPVSKTLYTGSFIVERDQRITVAPIATTFTVIGESVPGTLRINFLDVWAALSLETQQRRR